MSTSQSTPRQRSAAVFAGRCVPLRRRWHRSRRRAAAWAAAALLCLPGAAGAEPAPRSFSFSNGAGVSGTATHQLYHSRHGEFFSHNGTPVSQFFIQRDYGSGALHYGSTVAGDERHHYGGLSLGPATLAVFQAGADSFSKAPNALYPDLNQYFFHGGSRSRFEIRGAGANVSVGGGIDTRFAVSNVSAPGVEDRRGYYLGAASRRFEAGVFQLERGDEQVGRGLDLSFTGRRLEVDFQALRSEFGASVRRMAFEWRAPRQRRFSIELEQASNELFSHGDEQRVMFRFRKSFGGGPAFHAAGEDGAGDDDAGAQQGRRGFGKIAGIGIGVGVAAAALSSGDSDRDSAQRFRVRDNAARTVLNEINPVSVRENREHGGWVFRNADNTFGFTEPVAGSVASVNLGDPVTSVPPGTRADASYHTHGGPDPRFDNENFSPQDLAADRIVGVDGYLGTPAGFMKLHLHRTGEIRVLGRINN